MNYKTRKMDRVPIWMLAVLGTALSITGWYRRRRLGEPRPRQPNSISVPNNTAVALQNGINEYLTKHVLPPCDDSVHPEAVERAGVCDFFRSAVAG